MARPAHPTPHQETPVERLDPVMVPIYRQMTPAQRIQAGLAATELVRDRLRAELAHRHPNWSARQVGEAVARRLLARDRV